jgi:hypothetical protein
MSATARHDEGIGREISAHARLLQQAEEESAPQGILRHLP